MEILPNIYQIKTGGENIPGLYAPNVFFILGTEKAVFIDTAYGQNDEINSYIKLWEEINMIREPKYFTKKNYLERSNLPKVRF